MLQYLDKWLKGKCIQLNDQHKLEGLYNKLSYELQNALMYIIMVDNTTIGRLTNDGLIAQLYSPLPTLLMASTPREIKYLCDRNLLIHGFYMLYTSITYSDIVINKLFIN